jgi:hypothetical protein
MTKQCNFHSMSVNYFFSSPFCNCDHINFNFLQPLEVGPGLLELGDDDDELLGMGNDFNILEYADPELDRAPGGGKTNILDFDLSEEHNEEKKEQAARPQWVSYFILQIILFI